MAEKGGDTSQRIAVTLATDLVEPIDRLKEQLGLRSRGRVLEQLLEELLSVEPEGEESDGTTPFLEEGTAPAPSGRGEIDEQAALVLDADVIDVATLQVDQGIAREEADAGGAA